MAAWSTAAATMMSSGNAQAASEVAQLAAGDNRLGIIATLALPALGWVLFNIGGPALNQLANMDQSNKMRCVIILSPCISPCQRPSACLCKILEPFPAARPGMRHPLDAELLRAISSKSSAACVLG